MFCLLLRMSTNKEDSNNFFTLEYYSNMIYEKKIFTISKIFNICILYGLCSKDLVKKMIHQLFELQPKYLEDLKEISSDILKNLTEINTKLDNKEDIFQYLLDNFANIASIVSLYPKSSNIFEPFTFLPLLPQMYENINKKFFYLMEDKTSSSNSLSLYKQFQIKQIKIFIISIASNLIHYCFINRILDSKYVIGINQNTIFNLLDNLIKIIFTFFIEENEFVR